MNAGAPQQRPAGRRAPPGGRDVGRLAGAAVAVIASTVEEVHRAVAARAVRADPTGALSAWQRRVAAAVYSSVRLGGRVAGLALGEGLARALPGSLPAPVVGVLAAAIGDRVEGAYPALDVPLTLRTGPGDALGDGTEGTDRLAVFVHGLACSDRSWAYRSAARWGEPASTYGTRLAPLGWSARYARYNTGRHISDSGAALDEALEALRAEWPVPLRRVVLVGHSMGGLVARAALHQGRRRGAAWAARTDAVVALGSPLLGADLEKGANVAAWALGLVPEGRPFAALVNGRSAGVKDLRFGYLQRDDWLECPPDALLRNGRRPLEPVDGVAYHAVSGRVGSLAGRAVGDGLVRVPSASGRHRSRAAVAVDEHVALTGLHHMDLLNHPAVDPLLRRWLA